MSGSSLVARRGGGQQFSIGSVRMELRVASPEVGGAFGLLEVSGLAGPWTVPHIHERGRESFYVLDGSFTFLIGDEEREVGAGDFVSIAPGTIHMMRAETDGCRMIALVPPRLEEMFLEMSELGPEALIDPEVRRALAARHDSIPARKS